MPKVSISIACFNKLEYTQQCLKALYRNTPEELFELIIVDNASSDCTHDWLRENYLDKGKNIILIKNSENVGFARAHNQAFKESKGDIFLPLNNDTIPLAGWLEPIIAAHQREDIGIVGSKLLVPSRGTIQHEGVYFMDNGIPYHVNFGQQASRMTNVARVVPAVTGAVFAVKRSLYEDLGGFDEAYRNGWEDIDFCLEARKRGYYVWYEPKSVLYHYEGQTVGRLDHDDINRVIFLKRHRKEILEWGNKIEFIGGK
jgi:GT2 family glycosyltransferase